MAEIINLYEDQFLIRLSNGTYVDMTSNIFEEAIKAIDNLVDTIVNEYREVILKTAMTEGNYDTASNILHNEIYHIVENEIKDPKWTLKWILYSFSMNKLKYYLEEMQKTNPELFKSESNSY